MTDERTIRNDVARMARMMARAGLAEAFGHVSARFEDGYAITSVKPFLAAGPDDVIMVPDLRTPPSGTGTASLEVPMHAAVYLARPDVQAICRGHSPAVAAWGVGTDDLPLLHGLGALAGRHVAVHDDVELITSLARAGGLVETLADDHCVILRSNGALAVGTALSEALTRLYYLEERARVALQRPDGGGPLNWGNRLDNTAKELPRTVAWMEATFGDG